MDIKVKIGNVLEISHGSAGKHAYLVTNASICDNNHNVRHYIGLSNLDNGNRYKNLIKVIDSFALNKIKLDDEFVDGYNLFKSYKEFANINTI